MTKRELIKKRTRLKKKLDYLWTDQAMDEEVLAYLRPGLIVTLIAGVLILVGATAMLYCFAEYDFPFAIRIGLCISVFFLLLIGLIVRENANASAFKDIRRRRNKIMRTIEKVEAEIRERDRELYFPPTSSNKKTLG